MKLEDIHATLYGGMPEGTIINICEMSDDEARLVSDNSAAVAQALGHTGDALEAAHDGDTWYINEALTAHFQSLLAEHGVSEA